MSSDQCSYEMMRAIERHTLKAATIIPILLRPVAMLEFSPFNHLLRFPRDGRAISECGSRKGTVFAAIADEIGKVVESLKSAE
jgi:hypothetical protein